MTIEELASISQIKESTVKRNFHRIAGVKKLENGTLIIPDGSRYPFDIHRYKLRDIQKRREAF